MTTENLLRLGRYATYYNMGPHRMSRRLTEECKAGARITRKNAARLIKAFHEAFPKLRGFYDQTKT